MQPKERMLCAIRRGKPDRIPMFDFLFQKPLFTHFLGRTPGSYNGRDAVELATAMNHDGVWAPFGGFMDYQPKFIAENVYIDEWGTTYKQESSSWPIDAPIDYPIKTMSDLAKYKVPDPTLAGRDADIVAAILANKNSLSIMGGVAGPFTQAMLMIGLENICYMLYDDPELIKSCCRISIDFSKEAAKRSVAAGCDCMWMSEDLGSSQGGFMQSEQFKEYILPYIAELAEYIDSLGVPVLLHSCGCIWQYLDDLAQTKIASIHPLQRTAGMDIGKFKEQYGKRFCIIGNIDSSRTLPFGTPDDVEAEVKDAIAKASPGGGYVLASDHSLHDGIPIENIKRLIECGQKYGRY